MTNVPVPAAQMRVLLPARGKAVVKTVLSGDTVCLLGKPTTLGGKAPEVSDEGKLNDIFSLGAMSMLEMRVKIFE